MKQRVLTALGLMPFVLAALFYTHFVPIWALAILVAVLGGHEVARLVGRPGREAAVPAIAVAAFPLVPSPALALVAVSSTVLGVLCARYGERRWPAIGAGLWVAGPLLALLALHGGSTDFGWSLATPVLMAILPLWVGDTLAIFVGRAWGKHLLAPRISPKKTWEGGVANGLGCLACALWLGISLGIAPLAAGLCGLCAALLGQAGDLYESWLKRRADVKDSGTLLPGHGGVLDRIDSILFTAPAVLLVLRLTGHG